MTVADEIEKDLRQHLTLYREILTATERDRQVLRSSDGPPSSESTLLRKQLLARLNQSLDGLRRHRQGWEHLGVAERARHPQIGALIRQNQELIMKIIVLQRENEQGLLRQGLVPAKHLPALNQQRPHYVADLYRRHKPN
jgi:hypothetical protein